MLVFSQVPRYILVPLEYEYQLLHVPVSVPVVGVGVVVAAAAAVSLVFLLAYLLILFGLTQQLLFQQILFHLEFCL